MEVFKILGDKVTKKMPSLLLALQFEIDGWEFACRELPLTSIGRRLSVHQFFSRLHAFLDLHNDGQARNRFLMIANVFTTVKKKGEH